MTDQEKIACLLTACDQYHDALDMAFAMLVGVTAAHAQGHDQFYPSRSPMWPKMTAAKALVDIVRAEQYK